MLKLIQKIKLYTEAGIILEHMELFDAVEKLSIDEAEDIMYFEKEAIEYLILKNDVLFDTTGRVKLDGVNVDRVLNYAFAFGTLYNNMIGNENAIKEFWSE